MTSTPDGEVTDLRRLAADLLARADGGEAGRAARTLPHPVEGLRQTVIALRAGAELAEHDSPGPASLHVLQGRARLVTGERTVEPTSRGLAPIPPRTHGLDADEDTVVLLSVARR